MMQTVLFITQEQFFQTNTKLARNCQELVGRIPDAFLNLNEFFLYTKGVQPREDLFDRILGQFVKV